MISNLFFLLALNRSTAEDISCVNGRSADLAAFHLTNLASSTPGQRLHQKATKIQIMLLYYHTMSHLFFICDEQTYG